MLIERIIKRTLELKSYRIERIEEKASGALCVHLVSRKRSKPVCSGCRRKGPGYDRLRERVWRHVPMWGIGVEFIYRPRRVQCRWCGIKVERMPWAAGKSSLTVPFIVVLATFARLLSWAEVSRLFGVHWNTVRHAVKEAVSYGLAHSDTSGVLYVGIDEISRRKGHLYMTNVYDLNEGRLLWTGDGRDEDVLRRFFEYWGEERTQKLVGICCDMWKPYMNVIEECAPHATIVFDKFHIIRHLLEAVDEVRKEEASCLKDQGMDVLKGTKYLWLKNPWNWTKGQKSWFRSLVKSNLRVYRAFLIKEAFRALWKYKTVGWAKRYFKKWFWWATHSRLEPIRKFAWMVRRHLQGVLNIIKLGISNAIVEGMNRKAKVISQKAYGFRTPTNYALALYHGLGKLPLPETTHRFV